MRLGWHVIAVGTVFCVFAAESAKLDPGRVTAHRLNRAEYNYSVHDLLGVDFQPADDFPQDDSGYGFDNIGDVLSLSPVLMERYLDAAERVAHTALFGAPSLAPTMARLTVPRRWYAAPPDPTGLAFASALHGRYKAPIDGQYQFLATIVGKLPSLDRPLRVGLWIDGSQAGTIETERQNQDGKRVEFRRPLKAGEHTLSISFLDEPPPVHSPDSGRISVLEVGGPFETSGKPSPESRRLIYTCGHLDGHHQPGCDRRIISDLARRAFRRPVTKGEADRLVGLAAMAREKGDSFENGLALAIEAILVSPNFLFRIESDASSKHGSHAISQYELASRLSYFLWSSIPDNELLAAADRGALPKPAVLRTQVRRMLDDPKSARMVENFGGQWLETRRLESIQPDAKHFPEFDDYLRFSMRRESELFLQNIVREDRSLLDLLDGKYTFVNQRLADFYGIPGVAGTEFRKVDLSGTHRSGILTEGAVLTVSSYPNRTSPVLRGKWIMGNLLNAAPPPPPPNIPILNESAIGTSMSLRAQMEQHRDNAVCRSCHAIMDPLGFGLENFNAIGEWRTEDGSFPIDASGKLPDGRTFDGAAGLEAVLRQKPDAFARGVTEKLLIYALGRGLEDYDRPAVNAIVARAAKENYRFSSVAMGIVESAPFEMRREEP